VAPKVREEGELPAPDILECTKFCRYPYCDTNLWGAFWEVYKDGRGPDGKEFGAQGVIDGVTEYEGPIPAELA